MQEIIWSLGIYPIKDLKPHPKNPRQMSCEQSKKLEGLIKHFGLIDKPIINKDLTIIGGHQRIKLLKKMGSKTIECWIPDRILDQMEVDALCIGLNLNQGTFDYEILANEWDIDLLVELGFSEEQLFGLCKEEGDGKEPSKKKKKTCPSCGHEF